MSDANRIWEAAAQVLDSAVSVVTADEGHGCGLDICCLDTSAFGFDQVNIVVSKRWWRELEARLTMASTVIR